MNTNIITAPPAAMPTTEIWFDEAGLHIRQPGLAAIFVPAGRTGLFFDGLLQILVGSPLPAQRVDRVVL
jgi:hypothetical protein